MPTLIITVDLDKKQRPTAQELREAEFESELDYWIDFAMADPVELLDNADWRIVDNYMRLYYDVDADTVSPA